MNPSNRRTLLPFNDNDNFPSGGAGGLLDFNPPGGEIMHQRGREYYPPGDEMMHQRGRNYYPPGGDDRRRGRGNVPNASGSDRMLTGEQRMLLMINQLSAQAWTSKKDHVL